jgi:hypothetical protein
MKIKRKKINSSLVIRRRHGIVGRYYVLSVVAGFKIVVNGVNLIKKPFELDVVGCCQEFKLKIKLNKSKLKY